MRLNYKQHLAASLALLYFALIYFIPQMPVYPGFSSKISYLPFLFFALTFVVCRKLYFKRDWFVLLVYCLALTLLHIWAELVGTAEARYLNAVTSVVIKIAPLFIVYCAYVSFRSNVALERFGKIIGACILLTFLYALGEVFYGDRLSWFIYTFYKNDEVEILSGLAITFFRQTYFAAHVYLMLLSIALAMALLKQSYIWFALYLLSFSLVVMSQSKTGIVSAFFITVIIIFFSRRYILSLAIGIFVAAIVFYVLSSGVLQEEYVFRSTIAMLEGRSGSLDTRMGQIYFAFESTEKYSYLLGAGIGRDIYLESWVARVQYQYGLIGLILYILLWLYLVLFSLRVFFGVRNHSYYLAAISLGASAWFAIIPLISMSSDVFNINKNLFFVYFMYGVVSAIKSKHESNFLK